MNMLLLLGLASLFYLLPLLIGRAVTLLVWPQRHQSVTLLPVEFALGTGLIFAIALVIHYLLVPARILTGFQPSFFVAIAVLAGLSLLINIWKIKTLAHLLTGPISRVLALSLCFSAFAYFIWTWQSPYSLNWDLYEHQTLVHAISQGHFSYFTSQISDTFGFNSYPPVFHLLMALSQAPLNLSPTQILQYWTVIGFWHLWLVSLASYAFTYVITKKPGLSLLTCLIGTLTFESVIAFTSFFLLPQTLAAVLFIAAFSVLIWRKHHRLSLQPIEVLITAMLLIGFHYVIGGLAAGIFVTTFGYFQFQTKIDDWAKHFPLMETLILFTLAVFFGSQFINLNSLNHGEAAAYVFTLTDKFTFMRQAYGWFLLLTLPLGILAVIRSHDWLKKYLLLILVCFVFVFASQLPYVLKFFVLGRWFVVFFASLGIWSLIEKQRFALFRAISISVCFIFLSGILILNSLLWKQDLFVDQQVSHVSQDELAAAQFLKAYNPQQSTMIISDPATQYLLEGLSGINSPGGAFASQQTRTSLDQALSAPSSPQAIADLQQIHDAITPHPSKTLVVFSGRLFLWEAATSSQKMSFDYNVWQSHQLQLENAAWLARLDQKQLPIIYQNATVQIRELP